jgi:actin-like ATPase involved in cell morphogenesis
MEQLSEINIEAAAQKITDWLFDLGIIKDNVSEEQVLDALTEIISELISNINVDEASQKLVDQILQSGIVENIDGSVLKQLIEFKAYEFLLELQKEINAIEKIEFRISRK